MVVPRPSLLAAALVLSSGCGRDSTEAADTGSTPTKEQPRLDAPPPADIAASPPAPADTPPVRAPAWTELAVDAHGGCASDGARVWCWGLGVGERREARLVDLGQGDAKLLGLDVAGRRVCAAFDSGELRCHGPDPSAPITVTSLPAIPPTPTEFALSIAIPYREDERCVLIDGRVICLALPSLPLAGVVDFAVGQQLDCAALDDGSIHCWEPIHPPDKSAFDGPVATIAKPAQVEIDGALCVRGATEVRCSPFSHFGPWPIRPPALERVRFDQPIVEIAVGDWHLCARTVDGAVLCRGHNGAAQLGAGDSEPHPDVNMMVLGLPGSVTKLAAGGDQTCALVDGEIYCWGTDDLARVPAPGLGRVELEAVALHVAGERTCAQLADGSLRCWGSDAALGNNEHGGILAASQPRATTPVSQPITSYAPYALLSGTTVHAGEVLDHLRRPGDYEVGFTRSGVASIAGNGSELCLLDRAGWVDCRYDEDGSATLVAIDGVRGFADAAAVAVGPLDACVVAQGGTVHCAHLPASGESEGWQQVPGLVDARAVVLVDDSRGCALRAKGGVACWSGPTPSEATLVAGSEAIADIVEIIGSELGVCVRTEAGAVHCSDGQPNRAMAQVIERGAVEIAAGTRHWCARIDADGSGTSEAIECRGDDRRGQLGTTPAGVMLQPTAIPRAG